MTVTFKVNEAAGMKIASAKVDGKEYITNSKEDKSTVTVENVKVTENITISASFVEKQWNFRRMHSTLSKTEK